eukprot:366256-Chlamydomonas_euryale.AAC.2
MKERDGKRAGGVIVSAGAQRRRRVNRGCRGIRCPSPDGAPRPPKRRAPRQAPGEFGHEGEDADVEDKGERDFSSGEAAGMGMGEASNMDRADEDVGMPSCRPIFGCTIRKSPCKRDTRDLNAKQEEAWNAAMPELVQHRLYIASFCEDTRAAREERLKAELGMRCEKLVPGCCPSCEGVDATVLNLTSGEVLIFIAISGRVVVQPPFMECHACLTMDPVHPVSIDCLSATPSRARQWCDAEVLTLTIDLQAASATASNAWMQALARLHQALNATRPHRRTGRAQQRGLRLHKQHMRLGSPGRRDNRLGDTCTDICIDMQAGPCSAVQHLSEAVLRHEVGLHLVRRRQSSRALHACHGQACV